VTVSEFLEHFGVTNSRECMLMRRAFHIIDESDGGEERKLDFITFFVALHNFCVMDKTEMLRFAFKMFDRDNSGEVTKDEMRQMVIMVHGKNKKTDAVVDDLFSKMDFSSDGAIACFEFEQKSALLNNLLMPVHQAQQKLRDECMGQSYWKKAEAAKREFAKRHPGMIKDEPKYAKYFKAHFRMKAASNEEHAVNTAKVKEQMKADGCDPALLDTPDAQAPGGAPPCFDGNLVHLYLRVKADGEKAKVRRAQKEAAKAEAERAAAAKVVQQQAQLDEEAAWLAQRDAERAQQAAAEQATAYDPEPAGDGGHGEWVQYTDPASGYPYWYNETTGLSSWEDPATLW
jgi:Ca2+-binding EF-hand superfamily protein